MIAPLRHDELIDVGRKALRVVCVERLAIGFLLLGSFANGGIVLMNWLRDG